MQKMEQANENWRQQQSSCIETNWSSSGNSPIRTLYASGCRTVHAGCRQAHRPLRLFTGLKRDRENSVIESPNPITAGLTASSPLTQKVIVNRKRVVTANHVLSDSTRFSKFQSLGPHNQRFAVVASNPMLGLKHAKRDLKGGRSQRRSDSITIVGHDCRDFSRLLRVWWPWIGDEDMRCESEDDRA
ncbi:hypothetical protein VTK26DRAFT_7474 [Humicola hyalothermophila]